MKAPKIHPVLTELWDFAGREAKAAGLEKRYTPLALGAIGLNLIQEPNRIGYIYTPLNALSFAGSDELFFSFLQIPGVAPADHPVVMTVMGGYLEPNIIVGATMREFLSLGALGGFEALDSLASFFEDGGEDAISRVRDSAESLSPPARDMLVRFRTQFQSEPWSDIGARVQQLHKEWGRFVELSDDAKQA